MVNSQVDRLAKGQQDILRLLAEHPDVAISWEGPLANQANFTMWQRGWPKLRFGTFKALLRRGLIVHVANRQKRKGWSPMRYYRPATSREWVQGPSRGYCDDPQG